MKIEDEVMNYLHREMLCTLLRRFEELPKRHRLQPIKYTINTHLERYEKENNPTRVAVFRSLKLLIDSVKSIKELERLVMEKSDVEKVHK